MILSEWSSAGKILFNSVQIVHLKVYNIQVFSNQNSEVFLVITCNSFGIKRRSKQAHKVFVSKIYGSRVSTSDLSMTCFFCWEAHLYIHTKIPDRVHYSFVICKTLSLYRPLNTSCILNDTIKIYSMIRAKNMPYYNSARIHAAGKRVQLFWKKNSK